MGGRGIFFNEFKNSTFLQNLLQVGLQASLKSVLWLFTATNPAFSTETVGWQLGEGEFVDGSYTRQ